MSRASTKLIHFFIVFYPFSGQISAGRFVLISVKTLKQEYSCGYIDYTTLSPFVHPNFSISP